MNTESPSPGVWIVDGTVDGVTNPIFRINDDLEYGLLRRSASKVWCFDGVGDFFMVDIPTNFNNTLKSAVGLDDLVSSRSNFYANELTKADIAGRAAVVSI